MFAFRRSFSDRSWVLRGEPRTICGGGEYSSTAECPYLPLEPLAMMNSIVLRRDVRGGRVDPAEMPATHYGASEAFEVSCALSMCGCRAWPGDDGCPQLYLAFHLPHFRHLCRSTELPMPVGLVDCLTSSRRALRTSDWT